MYFPMHHADYTADFPMHHADYTYTVYKTTIFPINVQIIHYMLIMCLSSFLILHRTTFYNLCNIVN